MRFSHHSTSQIPSTSMPYSNPNHLPNPPGAMPSFPFTLGKPSIDCFNSLCQQLIKLSTELNRQLFTNTQLMALRDQVCLQQPTMSSSIPQDKAPSENNSTASGKNPSDDNRKVNKNEHITSSHGALRAPKVRKMLSQSDDYLPEDDVCHEQHTGSKSSESKNIPKNYSKAILAFIRKNDSFRKRVLRHLHIDHE